MAKFSRDALKTLVKECLVELLSEGLSSSMNESTRPAHVLTAQPRQVAQTRSPLTTPANFVASRTTIGTPAKTERRPTPAATNPLIASLTSDSVMRDILAVTANTTMVEQINEDRRGGMGAPPEIPAAMFETELFEGASSWADLAFSPRINGLNNSVPA